MATDLIRSAYRRAKWALVLRGVIALAIGVFILWRPMESIASLALVIALWAMFVGVVQIVHALELRAVLDRWWVLLLTGLVSLVFGIAAIYYYPGLSLAFAVVWFTWWLVVTGVLGIFGGLMEKKLGLSWVWTVGFGVLSSSRRVRPDAAPAYPGRHHRTHCRVRHLQRRDSPHGGNPARRHREGDPLACCRGNGGRRRREGGRCFGFGLRCFGFGLRCFGFGLRCFGFGRASWCAGSHPERSEGA